MLCHVAALATLLTTTGTVEKPSPSHQVRHVVVARGVQLEVLDWGGGGPTMVFLAGFGDTGHVFDDFAPQFTDHYHVVAITRRGFGASGRPRTGYDTNTLAADIVSILDSLAIHRATFVGHSFAGSELSYLGAFHADRVTRLVYLDASYDFARLYADSIWKNAFPIPRPPAPTTNDIDQWRRWFSLVIGPALPDEEIRALRADVSSAALIDSLERGAAPVDFSRIKSPALALWADPHSGADQYPYFSSLDPGSRERLQASFTAQQSVRRTHLAEFREQIPHADIVLVPGGRHYVFLSHPRLVADAIRAFLARQRAQPN